MRIALTIEKLDVRRGGAEMATVRLARQLLERGHEVHVFTEAVAADLPASVRVHPVPVRGGFVSLRQWSFAHGVARALRQEAFDATVACGRGFAEDIAWAQDISYPGTVEGSARSYYYSRWRQALRRVQPKFSPKAWMYGYLERRRFAQPPFLIAVSQMAARDFQNHYRLDPARTRVVYYQIDAERFSPEKLRPLRASARAALGVGDELVILFVGQNFRRKGVRPLVEAAARLPRKDFRVVIVGLGARQAAPYLKLARRLGCAERVTFRGESRQVQEWYAAADVFCLPTFYDSFGMVVLEAMAAGLPAITSQFSGAAELITPGQDGFVLQNPADAGEIAGMLETLFDPSLRAAVGAAALQTARAFMQNPKNEIGAVVEELAAAVFRGRHDRASGRLTGHDTG